MDLCISYKYSLGHPVQNYFEFWRKKNSYESNPDRCSGKNVPQKHF